MHPNYADKCDPVNRPRLGGGVVVKYSGHQKYATDAVSAAIVLSLIHIFYHVIEGQRRILLEAGYEQLLESQHWTLREGGKYFLTRNHSALIAFQVPKKRFRGFMLMASHSDSPALKAVSYTHLDVYKRQEYRPLGEDYRERGLRTGDPSETANCYHL